MCDYRAQQEVHASRPEKGKKIEWIEEFQDNISMYVCIALGRLGS